jgi:hypothetical protein
VNSQPMMISGSTPNSEKMPPFSTRATICGPGPAGSDRRNG